MGICYLQSLGLLGDMLEPEPVARFLRHCPGLSKQTIGDLLGENDQFFLDVLDAFTASFKFRGEPCCSEETPQGHFGSVFQDNIWDCCTTAYATHESRPHGRTDSVRSVIAGLSPCCPRSMQSGQTCGGRPVGG